MLQKPKESKPFPSDIERHIVSEKCNTVVEEGLLRSGQVFLCAMYLLGRKKNLLTETRERSRLHRNMQ